MEKEYVPTVCVDFDGTICIDGFPDFGPPLLGVREALTTLKQAGYKIRIYTCRINGNMRDHGLLTGQYNSLIDHLAAHNIPFDDIVLPEEGKPLCDFYIDDKGIRFEGNWPSIVDFVLAKRIDQLEVAKEHFDSGVASGVVKRLVRQHIRQNDL